MPGLQRGLFFWERILVRVFAVMCPAVGGFGTVGGYGYGYGARRVGEVRDVGWGLIRW